jgi:phage gpG-like protein
MAGSITIKLTPPDMLERLRNAPALVPQAIAKATDQQNNLTVGSIIKNRMTGRGPFPPSEGKLGVRTGRLRASLRATPAVVTGQTVSSSIGSNVKYMGIHEFGGETRPHLIKARNGKSLRFALGGRLIFAKSVKHPGSKIPARSPVFRGIEDRTDAYGAALSEAALKALEGS